MLSHFVIINFDVLFAECSFHFENNVFFVKLYYLFIIWNIKDLIKMFILYSKYSIAIFQLDLSKGLHKNFLTFNKDTNAIFWYMIWFAFDFTALMDNLFILVSSIEERLAIWVFNLTFGTYPVLTNLAFQMGLDEVTLVKMPIAATTDKRLVKYLVWIMICAEDPTLAWEGMRFWWNGLITVVFYIETFPNAA